MATKDRGKGMLRELLAAIGLMLLILPAGCGGGGGGGTSPGSGEVPVVLGQPGPGDAGNHFPFTIGNQGSYSVTTSEDGQAPQSFDKTITITETRTVGGQAVTVFLDTNPDGSGIAREFFLVKDANGIADFGNDDPNDTITPQLVPSWILRFPLETGASFVALDRAGISFGEDLDGDGVNESFDVRAVVTTVGFESLTVPAGTFDNCARVRTDMTLDIRLSSVGIPATASASSTTWYAPGIGPVRTEEIFDIEVLGQTLTETETEVLTSFTAVQEPPPGTFTVADDGYTWLGNSQITVPAAFGLLANDAGVTSITTFQNPSAQGGTVEITDPTSGGFTYRPPTGFTGIDTFTYTAADGQGGSASATVTVTVDQLAWYVKNDFAGISDGSSAAPFNNLGAASSSSASGDILFVFTGDGTANGQDPGIDLLANQRLLGQGVGLDFDVLPGDPANALLPIGGAASTAANPAAAPIIADTVTLVDNLPIIGLASGVEVAGLIVDGTGAVATLNGLSGTGITGFDIHDTTIRNVPRAGIQLTGATGGTGIITGNALENLLGPENAIDIVTSAAGATFTLSGNTLAGVAETAIRVQFTGAGGGTVSVDGNTLTDVGTTAGRRGIDVDGAGTGAVVAEVTNNTVDNSALGVAPIARAGIQVNGAAQFDARIAGNTVRNANAADGGVQVQSNGAAGAICLAMTGNDSDSGFLLDLTNGGALSAEGPDQTSFEAANTLTGGTFTYLPTPAAVNFVPVGTCGFAP